MDLFAQLRRDPSGILRYTYTVGRAAPRHRHLMTLLDLDEVLSKLSSVYPGFAQLCSRSTIVYDSGKGGKVSFHPKATCDCTIKGIWGRSQLRELRDGEPWRLDVDHNVIEFFLIPANPKGVSLSVCSLHHFECISIEKMEERIGCEIEEYRGYWPEDAHQR